MAILHVLGDKGVVGLLVSGCFIHVLLWYWATSKVHWNCLKNNMASLRFGAWRSISSLQRRLLTRHCPPRRPFGLSDWICRKHLTVWMGRLYGKSFHMVFLNIWDGFYKLHIIGSKFWAHPPWAFSLTGSVRQGCVLSPRLFNAVLLVGNVGLEKWEWFQFKQRFWHIIRFTVCWWG